MKSRHSLTAQVLLFYVRADTHSPAPVPQLHEKMDTTFASLSLIFGKRENSIDTWAATCLTKLY